MVDTFANALLPNYDELATLFLVIVAVPSVLGELAFAVWILMRGGKGPEEASPVANQRALLSPSR